MRIIIPFIFSLFFSTGMSYAQDNLHAIAMHGQAKYPSDFTHFSTVNPAAPKGGTMRLSAIGAYDTLNPFIAKGIPASSLGLIYPTLMQSGPDEAFTQYAGLAQVITMPEDRSSLTLTLYDKATWHDGAPITAQDVIWTFETLIEHGAPFYRAYYGDVETVTAKSDKTVHFAFKPGTNRELPLIIGQLPVLPKHYWQDRNFAETTLQPPLGGGPYRIADMDAGRSITYERVKNWWGESLPAYTGYYNFDRIQIDYYRDANVALEGFLAGNYDFRIENTAKTWATAYNSDAVTSGDIIMDNIAHEQPAGMQAFVMNIRQAVFADKAVRRALQYAFDFEWSNKQFAFATYTRTNSYFENSELASSDLPQGEELALLQEFKGQIPDSVFTDIFTLPVTSGNGRNRRQLALANDMLEQAGYIMGADKIRTHKDTGLRLEFEIIDNQAAFERWVLPMIRNLQRIGVKATFRVIDDAQLVNRLRDFDFDMTIHSFGQSHSPGNEQREFWGSEKADMQGSRNIIGIQDAAIDALIERLIAAPDRDQLVTATRALDRVLLHGYYVIPQWHINAWRVAYWDKFGKPDNPSKKTLNAVTTWWAKP